MEIKIERRGPQGKESFVFDRLRAGRGGHLNNSSNKICKFWLSGRCLKNPCRFAHSKTPDVATIHHPRKTPYYPHSSNALVSKTWRRLLGIHKMFRRRLLTTSVPKMFLGSLNQTWKILKRSHQKSFLRVLQNVLLLKMILMWRMWLKRSHWILVEGPWLFAGMPNAVKNTESGAEYSLNGPVGQVNALESIKNLLFAGVEDGVILAWKGTCESNLTFQLATTLRVSIAGKEKKKRINFCSYFLFQVWDHENWQCITTLNGHDDVVKSLMCWDKYLFSGSLDCTIKVWASTEDGCLEVIYTHSEEQSILALSGMTDPDVKPNLYCSCSDKSVHLYELPTFTDRGRLFARQEVQTLQIGPEGLFFTGDQTDLLPVYTWLAE
ncbi:hypothetical protein SO802_010509 [Lithocarpus litseifolius]|uniref:C3H1-type domain-containing protein n=1 Tax=Lithocarpus litseifolius TaxID=425828 RepID=A0AAW2DEE8_9ROSI